MPLPSVPSLDSNQVTAYCINLDRRPDRWEEAQREWAKFSDVPENLFRVKAVDLGSAAGCGLSHQLCVDHAKRKGFGFILVLEDDVVFKPNARELWRQQISALVKQERCDLFRPGLSGVLSSNALEAPLHQIKDASGLFITLYFESGYDTVLQWRPEWGHIDRWLSSHPRLVNLTALPFLATTSDGLSDIRRAEVKDSQVIAQAEARLAAQSAQQPQPTQSSQPVQSSQPLAPIQGKNTLGVPVRTTDGRLLRVLNSK